MDNMKFEFSDLIAGYVVNSDMTKDLFSMKTSDGRVFDVKLSANVFARMMRNLNEPYMDATGRIKELVTPGAHLFVYGTFYPEGRGHAFEAQIIDFCGQEPGQYRFEEPDWWVKQARSIGDFFIKAQFGGPDTIDYAKYRTTINLTGQQSNTLRQETDTISRLVYGFASTFLLTGEDRFLEAAEKGTAYLRDHMRFYDPDENIVYWYHGVDVTGKKEQKIFASEFGDDYDAIPAYEQIYALAGPTQTLRINGDPAILKDIKLTMDLFDRFYYDKEKGGYFSHLDPVTLDPKAESLGPNRGRKNWNSVGDHAPAYLINLWLATGEKVHKDFLEHCAECIVKYFPDYSESPFVQEKFHEDWSHDPNWGWQQDRGVVGHNLKIAWNLMRIVSLIKKDGYPELAKKIAGIMPKVGMDIQRHGWYDVMERKLLPGQEFHRFAWHDRKAWWQQEQGILAYQILFGLLKDPEYLRLARESAAFYNAFFLDHQDGAVYFNVLNNGIPYLLGTERYKGSHSMSGYHSIELAYLSAVYTNLLNTKQPLDLYFKPMPGGFSSGVMRIQPDILPPGSIKIAEVTMDGKPWNKFDSAALTVELPPSLASRPKFRVRVVPV